MEVRYGLCIAAAVFGFDFAALLALYASEKQRKASIRLIPQELGVKDTVASRVLRNGFAPLLGAAAFLVRGSYVRGVVGRARLLLLEKGFVTSEASLFSVVLAAEIALFLASTVVSGSLIGGAMVAFLLAAVAAAWVNQRAEARSDALRASIPEALRSMEACFQSGLSLMQTLMQVSTETKGSLSGLFSRAAHVLQAGGTSAESLGCLRENEDLPELTFVSVALDVQHQTGGSMKRCLESAIDMVEGEISLQRSLRVQTAQARLSARVVSIMPFALIALFSLISEGFLDPFFSSAAGMLLLATALTMQVAGILLVRRMLKVR